MGKSKAKGKTSGGEKESKKIKKAPKGEDPAQVKVYGKK